MRLAGAIIVASVLALGASSASADEEKAQSSASLSLTALSAAALSGSYERQLPSKWRLSGAAWLGLRAPTAGDYSSRTVALAAEARFWWTGRAIWSRYGVSADLAGPYLGLRLGVGRTTTRDDVRDQRIGDTLVVSETLVVGYRFTPWRGLEITPSTGIQLRHEFERQNRLASWTAGGFTFGTTVGWLF